MVTTRTEQESSPRSLKKSHFSQEAEVLQGLREKFDAVGRKLERKRILGDAKLCGTFLVAMILSPQ